MREFESIHWAYVILERGNMCETNLQGVRQLGFTFYFILQSIPIYRRFRDAHAMCTTFIMTCNYNAS